MSMDTQPFRDLTERETEVLKLISEGFNNDAIAEIMVIAPRTVDHHINRIFSKLGITLELNPNINSRVMAARIYYASWRVVL